MSQCQYFQKNFDQRISSFLFFRRYQTSPEDQTLSRSYSLELRRLSLMDSSSPTLAGHSAYFPPRTSMEKPYRSSSINALVNSAMAASQASLPNRKVKPLTAVSH